MNTHRESSPFDPDREHVTFHTDRESVAIGSGREPGPSGAGREPRRIGGGQDPVWERLTEQLHWYGCKSAAAQRAYRRVELCQIMVGAVVPVFAGLSAPPLVTATVATAVVVSEGAQQLFQWHTHWLLYRSTAEALKREKYLFLAGAGRYGDPDARTVLAQRVESILASTNTTWATEHDRPGPSAPPLVVPVKR